MCVITRSFFRPENIVKTLKVANDLNLITEDLSWFAGTKVGYKLQTQIEYVIKLPFNQEESATFGADDMKVVFFKPKMPDGQYNSMKSSYGVNATPGIEAGFYMDLTARSIDAVESMKRYFLDLVFYTMIIIVFP